MVLGAKRLGYGGETNRVENRGETTRGEMTRGETSWGRNVLLPCTVQFRAYQSFVCNLLSSPRCESRIPAKKI